MNKRLAIYMTVAVVLISCCAHGQEKLNGMVAYSLKKIPPALEKAEKLAAQGDLSNAKVYLESAQATWDMIHKDFKGKFDESHPDIVAVKNRLMALEAKIEGAPGPSEKASEDPGKTGGPAATEPLPSTMVYDMKQFGPVLDKAMNYVEVKQLDDARRCLEGAQMKWETKKEWNKGKFDPDHPDVVALDKRFADVAKAVGGLESKVSDMEGDLEGVLGAIRQNSEALKEAHDQAKWKVRQVSSLISDENETKMMAEMEKTRVSIERVNALLPGARTAVVEFRKQYPDMKELTKLVSDGRSARVAVEQVERFPKNWLEEVGREVTSALDEADKNIKMYGLGQLAEIEGGDKARQEYAADSAEQLVVIFSSLLLDTIDVLLPELPEADKAALPEFVAARKDALDRAAPMRVNIAKVEAAVRKIRKDMVDADHRKLAAARFPESEYHGGQWNDAEKAIRKAFEDKITDKQLLKIDIYAPWEVREEARWSNDHWDVKTYRYIGAHCLAKLGSNKCMVYRMNFRNTKLGDGSWSPLEQWSVGHVYEILEENIDK